MKNNVGTYDHKITNRKRQWKYEGIHWTRKYIPYEPHLIQERETANVLSTLNFENSSGVEVVLQSVNYSVIVSDMAKWQFKSHFDENDGGQHWGTLEMSGNNLFLHAGTDMMLTIEEGDFRFN